jgi:hypothetical protein
MMPSQNTEHSTHELHADRSHHPVCSTPPSALRHCSVWEERHLDRAKQIKDTLDHNNRTARGTSGRTDTASKYLREGG